MSGIRERLARVRLSPLLRVLIRSLLPGAALALVLFANAYRYDAMYTRLRNDTPSVDLSAVRLDGRALGAGEAYIQMYYPSKPNYAFIDGAGEETWEDFTINGEAYPDFPSVMNAFGGYGEQYLWVLGSRTSEGYEVFIDREHDLELRFYQNRVRLMRVDNRDTLAFLARREPELYDDARTDYGHVYGAWLFSDWDADGFLHKIAAIIREDRFLIHAREYLYIPIYGAAWLFPLMWAVERRKVRWFLAAGVWYPVWYVFCALTLLARQ